MNKSELIDSISVESELSKADSTKALDSIINVLSDALSKGDKISLIGFGTFSILEKKARTGRNPKTGETLQIAAKKVVKFKVGAELKAEVNKD